MMQIIWSLRLRHEYFVSSDWKVKLVMARESGLLMIRRGLMWKKSGENQWVLIAENGCLWDKEDRIELELSVRNGIFPYVTEKEIDFHHDYLKIEKSKSLGITYKLIFLLGEIKDYSSPVITEIVFNSLYKHLEYIFIFRDGMTHRKLIVEDSKHPDANTFEQLPMNEYLGKTAAGFRSIEKKLLKEKGMGDFNLWEEFPMGGRKLLFRHLPEPSPGMFPDAPADSIRRIMYV